MRSLTRLLLPLSLVASAQAANHDVTVGQGGRLEFNPEVLKAEVGDTIRYVFYAKNHSVAESNFKEPCRPLEGGFFSGFVPFEPQVDTPAPTEFTITLEDTKPKWMYCSQGNHCKSGMVHAINPPETGNTFEAYKKAAGDVKASESPANVPVGGVRRTNVNVGKGEKLEFQPSNIIQPKGTIINFMFHPKNHTVAQSSFNKPCQPLADGFSSGFIPVSSSPSGVEFSLTVEDDKPIWFYCGQGKHCQSGMVGAINAPTKGNTLEAFTANAKAAEPPNSIPDNAPLGGVLTVKGKTITSFNGSVLPPDLLSPSPSTTNPATTTTGAPSSTQTLPPPSADAPQWYMDKAGGGKPAHYNWAPTLSPNATAYLQLHGRIEDILLHLLWEATQKLDAAAADGGAWAGIYPRAIVDTIVAWAAQSLIHRATTAEVLGHYKRAVPGSCGYKLPMGSVDDFLKGLAVLNGVQIGVLIDISARVAAADPFVIPILMTQVGAKSRAAGVVNMMQNHMAAAAPREVAVPAVLAWSFVMARFVESCPDEIEGMPDKAWPVLTVGGRDQEGERVVNVDLVYEGSSGDQFVAWLGPYGMLEFTPVAVSGDKKTASVPEGWYGDVWIVVVSTGEIKLDELADHMVAGPEMLWISEP
ncbi:hypothetical protein C8A00DRAFT_45702 [Chaetomidium leptoderma]|uniref:Cupredoxin n=1 Tax=Chaetomidium leptoderma TaxID=669021 RepID=A0AAN6ZU44_9PEZI|nr:hypothetical protein C8A00DRAFT_45702 [Chaetomidium leptoderma]